METGDLKVLFKRRKGARFSQPYTVPTTCPDEWRTLVRDYLLPIEPSDWVFPGGTHVFGARACMALRTIEPSFTVRALRRGALQAMSRKGASEATLMLFSGHKRADTLMRYLDWGAESADRAQQAREAALHLVA